MGFIDCAGASLTHANLSLTSFFPISLQLPARPGDGPPRGFDLAQPGPGPSGGGPRDLRGGPGKKENLGIPRDRIR